MSEITLRQLKIFEALIETKGYTRAASSLHMTQPAVSMQIKQMQEHVGKPLFERQGKKVELTEAGKSLQEYSSRILHELQDMEARVDEIRSGVLNIKISAATTANHLVSHMLATFSAKNSNINFSLDITNRADLVQQLHNYEPDLVIMGEPPPLLKNELHFQPIMVNPLVMIAAPDHKFSSRDHVSMEELSHSKFIVREKGSGTKAAIDRVLAKHGCAFTNTTEMSSNEAIKYSVMAGLGLGIASLHTIKMELESGHLVMIKAENFPIIRHWHIIKRKGKSLSPAAQAFQKFVMQEADNYMKSYSDVYVCEES